MDIRPGISNDLMVGVENRGIGMGAGDRFLRRPVSQPGDEGVREGRAGREEKERGAYMSAGRFLSSRICIGKGERVAVAQAGRGVLSVLALS